ncbi:MAG TPA: TIM barrel protein [Phycisphaerae bacterium]|nr:TIM barrel protein [Phycisphaerae bacterium]
MSERSRVRVTLLSSMAGREVAQSFDRHVEWGVELLDLKDGLFGKGVLDLTDDEARRLAEMAAERSLEVYCLSTGLFGGDLDSGPAGLDSDLVRVERAVAIARILRPHFIRLLAAGSHRRGAFPTCMELLDAEMPWAIGRYRQAIDRIAAGGFLATIENEVGQCIFRTPEDVAGFFGRLDRRRKVCFTWDVQNLWQMGTFPTVEVYEQIAQWIGYVHLKGGRCEPGDPARTLAWRSPLAEASWPVSEIVRRAVADGRSPVLCLNPSHGRPMREGVWEDFTRQDLGFVRRLLEGPVA